jgi:hypothetical protein
MMTTISPDEWATRIPWHPKAQILAALDRALETKRQDLTRLEDTLAAGQDVVDVLWARAAARTHLELRGTDAEGRARLQMLDDEIRAAARTRSIRDRVKDARKIA